MIKHTLLAVLLVLVCGLPFVAAQEPSNLPPLPSLNYWQVTATLLMEPDIQLELNVSPQQAQQINSLRGSAQTKSLISTLRAKEVDVFIPAKKRDDEEKAQLTDSHTLLYLQMDSYLEKELNNILLPEQMRELRRVCMRFRYDEPTVALSDPEVQDFIGLTKDERESLSARVQADHNEIELAREQLYDQVCSDTVGTLPSTAKYLLAQYMGNKYLPETEVSTTVDLNTIPFPKYATMGNISLLSRSRYLQQSLSLTSKQANDLKAIVDRRFKRPKHERKLAESAFEAFKNANIEATRDGMAILSSQQVLALARFNAQREFLVNPVDPLSRPELVKYLGLTTDEAKAAVEFAVRRVELREERKSVLSHNLFEKLSEILPENARQRFRLVFKGVW